VLSRPIAYVVAATLAGAVGFGLAGVLHPVAILSPSLRPFITEGASVGVPVWSPDGRTLAYMAGFNGQSQVFLRAIDATESTQVTRGGADGISMFWSPDGSRIYFTRSSDGALVSVSAGGGEPQVVTTAAPDGEARSARSRLVKVCMSPDGRTIVFGRGEPGNVRLWTLDTRTGDMRQLNVAGMAQPLANVQALAFSPDGTSLAAVASQTAMNDARGVWLMSWPGGSARQVFSDVPYLASNPSIGWLPDSRRFVMNGYPLHGGASRLLLAEIGSGLLTELTAGKDDEGSPNVAPDGSRIAFVSRRSGLDLIQLPVDGGPPEPILATSRAESFPDVSRSGAMAYVTDAAGSLEVRIRSSKDAWPRTIGGSGGPERDRATQPAEVRLSPDGQRLAVNTYAVEHLIWIYPTAGGTRVRLDAETTDQHGPSWSPDGNWIAYRRLKNGQWEVVKAPVGGGAVVRLGEASPGGGPTDWSANDEWIAHSLPDGIHLVSPDGARTRVLAGIRSSSFRFSRDGARLFAAQRAADRRWELTIWDLTTVRQLRVVALPLAASAEIQGMALAPDESHIIVGTGTATADIWLLERFEPPALSWLSRLTRR
jgi:Tol biopolymer transport system component